MKYFFIAFQFLTIIPLRIKTNNQEIAKSLFCFPIIGLFLGILLVLLNNFLSLLALPPLLISSVLVITLIILTGGLHLDGLADTFDGLYGVKTKEERLEIMRDPHIGTMGVLILISVILLKITLLFSLASKTQNISLILMCLFSRYFLVFSLFLFPYARLDGKAKVFFDAINLPIFLFTTAITLICAIFIFGVNGYLILAICGLFVFLVNRIIQEKIDGITGDNLGASVELSEIFILLTILLIQGAK